MTPTDFKWLPRRQNLYTVATKLQHSPFLVVSYWEQNWRKNLKLITVDETPKVQQIQVSNWLKVRCEHLLDTSSDLEAECLFQEFDTYDFQDTCC